MNATKTAGPSLPLASAALLFRQLATLTDGGLTPGEAVAVMREDQESTGLSATLAEIARDLEQRDALAPALERHIAAFGVEVVSFIRAAEERGALPAALGLLADDLERRLQLRKGMMAVLLWPACLLAVLALITTALLIFVVPAFKATFASFGSDLPGLTLFIIGIGDILGSFWYVILPLLVALPFGVARLRRSRHGAAVDALFLKIPGVRRFLIKLLVSRLSALIAAVAVHGVPAGIVMGYARSTVGNRHLRSVVGELERDVKEGVPLAAAWRRQTLLPRGLAQLLDIGERSRKLEPVLARAAQSYALDAAHALSTFRQALLVSAYVLAGVVVGVTVIAFYLPIFKLGAAI